MKHYHHLCNYTFALSSLLSLSFHFPFEKWSLFSLFISSSWFVIEEFLFRIFLFYYITVRYIYIFKSGIREFVGVQMLLNYKPSISTAHEAEMWTLSTFLQVQYSSIFLYSTITIISGINVQTISIYRFRNAFLSPLREANAW